MDNIIEFLKDKEYYCNLDGIETIINDIKRLGIVYYERRDVEKHGIPDMINKPINTTNNSYIDITLKEPELSRSMKYLLDKFYINTFHIRKMLGKITDGFIHYMSLEPSKDGCMTYRILKPELMILIFNKCFWNNMKLLYLDLAINGYEKTSFGYIMITFPIDINFKCNEINKVLFNDVVLFSAYRQPPCNYEYIIDDGVNPCVKMKRDQIIRYYYEKIRQIMKPCYKSARSIIPHINFS